MLNPISPVGRSPADHRDALLDEALDQSFPASDPPSMTRRDDLDDQPTLGLSPDF